MQQLNHITKLAYQGRNQNELLATKELKGFKSDEWLTFLQAKSVNLKIIKGSKGVSVFKGFREFAEIDDKSKKVKGVTRPLGFARVFNLDQTEKYEPKVEN